MGTGASPAREWSADRVEQSKTYLRVYCLLIGAATERRLVYYSDVADLMGLSHAGQYTGQMTGRMLGTIVDREVALGRPMLSAVAVSVVTGHPGKGFYWLAEQKGLISEDASAHEQRAFWERERDRVFEAWAE
jgi:hypothetical protein